MTLWCFTTALRECRDPWAPKLAPEIESSKAKVSARMWNLVGTTIAASIADSGMEYVTPSSPEASWTLVQKTFLLVLGMSALPPKADIRQQSSNGTPGPKIRSTVRARNPIREFFVKFCSQNFYEMLAPFRGDRIVGYVRSWPLADI
jgi:hypothetical protein